MAVSRLQRFLVLPLHCPAVKTYLFAQEKRSRKNHELTFCVQMVSKWLQFYVNHMFTDAVLPGCGKLLWKTLWRMWKTSSYQQVFRSFADRNSLWIPYPFPQKKSACGVQPGLLWLQYEIRLKTANSQKKFSFLFFPLTKNHSPPNRLPKFC